MTDRVQLEARFEQRMYQLYREAARVNYFATYFLRMLEERKGLATAQHCLASQTDGFTKLWEIGRLDLSVEYAVLEPRWKELFTDAERAVARQRLQDARAAELIERAEATA